VNLAACCLADGRRTVRQRKVSTRVAVVTDADRRNAANARLEALETDHDAAPTFQDSDEEFVLNSVRALSGPCWVPEGDKPELQTNPSLARAEGRGKAS